MTTLEQISEESGDPLVDIAIDALKKNKQLIVFVNTKRSAEAVAERLSTKAFSKSDESKDLKDLSDKSLHALSSPTKQCKRLSRILLRGVSFHHSGLNSSQRDLVEDGFKNKFIKIICATPTLAAGVDLPAGRVIIRDLKRYGGVWGMSNIPVLEYEQMSGRAGRPKFDKTGEAVCIASSNSEKEDIWESYVNGLPEEILSKLAVEPVLRTYILSLVATGIVGSNKELKEFMSKTFYAFQYKDIGKLFSILDRMVSKLEEWEFISVIGKQNSEFTSVASDFISASDLNNISSDDFKIRATKLGERVAELYLDPYTAHYLLTCMQRAKSAKVLRSFSFLQMISWTLEMRPFIRMKQKDIPLVESRLVEESGNFYSLEPPEYSEEYDEFMDTIKTAIVFDSWVDEFGEDRLFDEFQVTPGELNAKLDRADWLLFSCYELSKLQGFREISNFILKLRIRLKNGVKEELLPLLKLKGVGRVRARKLYANSIKDLGDVKKIDISSLASLIGKKLSLDVKKQVGQNLSEDKIKIKPNKRKGQISLEDF
ncbi:hypothetical protein K9L67_00810 [Candidatus Woesearchaeota archaeon]|nr:hypothetical protein [Candidatus Woesearchaeota archaeon]MCF7900746.1 hypothetical protein [Candidatus Woesearchaeota archaeon]MCF8012911.1 hypothetical protein [Candidatus Woesearchaeota archaeon]